ncbi:MAG: type VI secretion system protein TssA [Holosporaceae bacterium]|jgi:type VI secretion system protein ImpA|nr:type VI secretion system protein TssA [Holosporaceae bacterium]
MLQNDLSKFLTPISHANRCGEYLKYDYVYDQIKEFRREDDMRLSQGVWQMEPKKANWPEVNRICSNLLQEKTKDLQIAMWLLEAWIATNKIKGFQQGIKLLSALCENFWNDIHPQIDWENHNFISRLSPFYFFADKIQEKLVLIPLTESTDGLSTSHSLSDWMAAQHNLQTKNSKGLSFKQLRKGVLSTDIEFFQTLQADIESCVGNLRTLYDFITQKCGNEAPSFKNVFDCLEEIKRITLKNLQDKTSQMQEKHKIISPKQDVVEMVDKNQQQETPASANATIAQAYATLDDIANFLEKAQPQSPASSLIKIASAIGKKNFTELLEININSGASIMTTISELYRVINTNSKCSP